MNSRVLFYNVFLFLALLSCSHDGNPEIDETGDASLSLCITIPQIGTRAGDSGIERLYVAIFGTSGEDADKLIVSREVTQTNAVEDITPLKAGTISGGTAAGTSRSGQWPAGGCTPSSAR